MVENAKDKSVGANQSATRSVGIVQRYASVVREFAELKGKILFSDIDSLKLEIVASLNPKQDLNLLERIIAHSNSDTVRNAAIEKLHSDMLTVIKSLTRADDWKLLEDISLQGETEKIQAAALDKLLSIIDSLDSIVHLTYLEEIAHNGATDEIRKTAIANLHHEKSKHALQKIASCVSGTSFGVKKTAGDRLNTISKK